MISKIDEIAELDNESIKSVLAFIEPEKIAAILQFCDNSTLKNKMESNLSDETRKKIKLQTSSFKNSTVDKEEIKKNFIAIVNRVLNFR
ncbi:MAG: FliG C-terminal domain-containing protein [Candidatus Muiribacteriota bacterium]